MHRYGTLFLVVLIPLLVVLFVLFGTHSVRSTENGVLPTNRKLLATYVVQTRSSSNRYVVIFDADSSGSRVHAFCFDQNMDLVPNGEEIQLFEQLKPGLNAYAANPKEAAKSLLPLLAKAENVVPEDMHQDTPVKVGATAGLRQLGVDTSERILEAVKDFMKIQSRLKSSEDWVTVLNGTQEGSYLWIAINYLLTNIGKTYSETVGVVDLGGGSVMAYAISEEADAVNAPKVNQGEDPYVKDVSFKGTKYYLYVHSWFASMYI